MEGKNLLQAGLEHTGHPDASQVPHLVVIFAIIHHKNHWFGKSRHLRLID